MIEASDIKPGLKFMWEDWSTDGGDSSVFTVVAVHDKWAWVTSSTAPSYLHPDSWSLDAIKGCVRRELEVAFTEEELVELWNAIGRLPANGPLVDAYEKLDRIVRDEELAVPSSPYLDDDYAEAF